MKRIAAVLLLMSMLPALCSVLAAAEQEIDQNAEDYGLLAALSVIDPEDWADGTAVTRAEFIQLCVNLTGNGGIRAGSTAPVFTDVTVGHWAYDAIMYAYSMGCVAPYADGRLLPETPVSYGDAVQILVRFLGYDVMAAANNRGQAEQACYTTASDIGLLKGVSADGLQMPLLKQAAVRMAFNALTVDLPVQYFADNRVHFSVQEDRTLLRTVYHASRGKGVVTADDYAALSLTLAKKNYLTIGGESYSSVHVDTTGLLGCSVVFYYTQADEEEEKTLIYLKESGNEIVWAGARDLLGYANMSVRCTNGQGKTVTYKMDRETTVLWNNRIITSAEYEKRFQITSGAAKLIDNDGDGVMEAVLLESQQVAKIDVFDTAKLEIRTTGGAVYALEDYGNYRVENGYGEPVDALSMHAGDVISILDPEDPAYTLVIRICGGQEAGTVEAVDREEQRLTLDNGREAFYSRSALEPFDDIRAGDTYTFCFDIYGEIADAAYVRPNELEVAYLIDYQTAPGLQNTLQLKALRADGTVTVLDCASKIRMRDKNGNFTSQSADGAMTLLNQGGAQPKRQAVMLRTNARGAVNEIQLLAGTDHPELAFHEVPYTAVGGSGLRWYQPAYSFHNVIQLKPDTVVFAVPHADRTDSGDEDFFIADFRLFKGAVYYPETGADAYFPTPVAMEKDAVAADYLVWEYPESGQARTSYINRVYYGIVTNLAQVMEEDGTEYVKITYCTTAGSFGNTILYKNLDGSLDLTDLNGRQIEVGDVISVGEDYYGYATNATVTLYYDYSAQLIIRESTTSNYAFYDTFRLAQGTILKKNDGYVMVEIERPSGTKLTQVLDLSAAITLRCDMKNKLFTKDRAPDSLLAEGEPFFMIIGGALPKAVILYES